MAPRRFQRALWIASGIASLCATPITWAQKHDPTLMPAPVSSNVGCDIAGCQPRPTSYGYYRENWRRWPEEPATPSITPKLSPYAVIPRSSDAPRAEIPDSRDEVSPRQRHTPSIGGASSVPSSPVTGAAPTVPPPTAASAAPTQPSPAPATSPIELPEAPASELPSDDGLPAGDELPDATETPADEGGLPSDNEPLFPSSPAEETTPLPEAEPETEDELLDSLPDLGQDSRRLQRYQSGRTGNYRRADDERPVSQARRRPAAPKRAVATATKGNSRPKRSSQTVSASPVAYRAPTGRRNPLRQDAPASPATTRPARASRGERVVREVVPVEFIEDEATGEFAEDAHDAYNEAEWSEGSTNDRAASDVTFSDDSATATDERAPQSSSTDQGRSNPLRDSSL